MSRGTNDLRRYADYFEDEWCSESNGLYRVRMMHEGIRPDVADVSMVNVKAALYGIANLIDREMDDLGQQVYEYDNYIQWLASVFVPQDRWDEVYDQMTKMGIDYVGADDV